MPKYFWLIDASWRLREARPHRYFPSKHCRKVVVGELDYGHGNEYSSSGWPVALWLKA
jgi:hypothetical protein